MTPVLEAQSVTKTYEVESSVIRAVDEVSISICPGEFAALVGPSGSGKTTMLAMLAGLLSPTAGNIFIGGQDLADMTEAERTRFRRESVGFTFQSNNLVPYLTVQENVELMLKLNHQFTRETRDRTREILAQLGLQDRMKNLPSQLSGGQQQRVAIARAMVHRPAIVLADEPTASLDTQRAVQVVQTFADLIHAENLAGIMVTHDLRMVRFVDKIIQMRDGKISSLLTDKEEIRRFANAHLNQGQLETMHRSGPMKVSPSCTLSSSAALAPGPVGSRRTAGLISGPALEQGRTLRGHPGIAGATLAKLALSQEKLR